MGCCAAAKQVDFTRVSNKKELINSYEIEINRIHLLKHSLILDSNKQLDSNKDYIMSKIIYDYSKVLIFIVKGCDESHILKLKFLFEDFFKCTETWNTSELEDIYTKISNFYMENKSSFRIAI